MKRGELWTAAASADYASKPRPVVIVQADQFVETESLTVAGLTSEPIAGSWFRPMIEPTPENGLRSVSQVMIDKILTIPRRNVRDHVGQLTRIWQRQAHVLGERLTWSQRDGDAGGRDIADRGIANAGRP